MADTVTLGQLVEDIRFQSDGLGLSARHTPAALRRAVNKSIKHFREIVSADGVSHYLESYSSTTGAGASSPFHFRTLDLSTGPDPAVVRVYGIDVNFDGNWRSLLNVDFSARNDYGTNGGEVAAFANYQTAKVALLPAPSTSRTFVAWYLPVFENLDADSDTWNAVNGWEQWVVWDVTAQIVNRDEFPQAYSMAVAERDAFRRDIKHASAVVSHGAVTSRRDTWAERRLVLAQKELPPLP